MEVVREVSKMQEISRFLREKGRLVGFVPTMGYLHEGHLSLFRAAKRDCEVTVASIFVNPLQFGPKEDFATYPRDLQRDFKSAETEGIDYVFIPSAEEIYPQGFATFVEVTGTLTNKMCAFSRPGHFRGVATVVLKLLQIVLPSRAYFGQKDMQQALVIKRMVRDLHVGTEIIACPIIREKDGLALSSRNSYLTPVERQQALALPQALAEGRSLVEKGERNPSRVKEKIEELLKKAPGVTVDYVEVCHGESLEDLNLLFGPVLLAAAVLVGKTRLIDNLYLEVS